MMHAPSPKSLSALAQRIQQPLARDKADTLLLLLACTLVLAPHAMHLPLWTSLACSALLLWRGWITFSGSRMPPRWLLLPVALAAMASVYAEYRTFLGQESGVTMLVMLIALKLLEMHAKRDLFVVLFLSFFLLLSNLFYSQTIGTAALMLVSVVAILTAQISFQYTGAMPSLRRRLGLGAFIVALAAPLMLVLFILFPRIQGPLWGLPSDALVGRSGLSDSMEPGNISQLALSDEVAFRVKFLDPVPPQAKLYWRGVVLGQYDGRRWTRQSMRGRRLQALDVIPRGAPIRHQVTLEPSSQRWLFALELPEQAPTLSDNPVRLTPNLYLLAERPINARVRYDVVSYTDFTLQANESAAVLQESLQLPRDFNPQALALGARLRAQSRDPLQLTNTLLQYFNREQFRYTLEPPLLGQHAVDEFLFGTRAGFCEHYASAFVVVMRAAGVPARVVTGYQGGKINRVDGFMTVRQLDAHAWAEVWVKERGWVRVDPTAAVAPNRIEQNLSAVIPPRAPSGLGGLITLNLQRSAWLASLRLNWEAMNNSWNQWVLDYTPTKQRNLLSRLGFDQVDWRMLTALMFGVGTLVMGITLLPLLLNRQKNDPLRAVYISFCQLMTRQGYPRKPYEGPRAYQARLTAPESTLAPDKKTSIAGFLTRYESIQYGRVSAAPLRATVAQLKSLLAQCR